MVLDLAFRPDRAGQAPLYRQLQLYLRDLVQNRRLEPGERLPASRELANTLGLSRNTVNQAYAALIDDGFLRAHVGQGTFVTSRVPVARPAPPLGRSLAWEGLFARRTRAVLPPPGLANPFETPHFDFRPGFVDGASLPFADLKRAYGRAIDAAESLTREFDPAGYRPLRAAIARWLVARGIGCETGEVAIVNGAQQALDLVARVLIDPGDTVALEQPGYFGSTLACSAAEAHLVGVGVDAEGLRTDELARVLRARRVKLLVTTPAVQSPTGVALSEARRRELLALADEFQLPIVEDDYDSPLHYGGPPVPALKNLDRSGQVIYVGTFSKALFAGLRLGYVVAPRPLLQRLVLSRWASDFNTDIVTQAALTELLEAGGLERHVRRVRQLYGERRTAMLAALETHMPEGTRWLPPAGGSAVWTTLPAAADPVAVHAAANAMGLGYGRGSAFFLASDGRGPESRAADRHVLLSFARSSPAKIDEGIARFAEIVRSASAGAQEDTQ